MVEEALKKWARTSLKGETGIERALAASNLLAQAMRMAKVLRSLSGKSILGEEDRFAIARALEPSLTCLQVQRDSDGTPSKD